MAALVAVAASLPAAASAQEAPSAELRVRAGSFGGGRLYPGDELRIVGTLRPFVAGQRVDVLLTQSGKTVGHWTRIVEPVGRNAGRVVVRSQPLTAPGRYVAKLIHHRSPRLGSGQAVGGAISITYPDLRLGERSHSVAVFNRLLNENGYRNAPDGSAFNASAARAVHAFRKVNGMNRNETASSNVYRLLASGQGEFRLAYPSAGKHVEVDISRQVMVLADHGEAQYTYAISSGASATPSDRGRFRFYRKDPGYNSIGMYYSVYYNGGEATHGYHSVPDYPASHGCIRNPIPDSRFIYEWIDIGDDIWVYE